MRTCFSIQCLCICTGGGRRHKSQLNGDWYLHKLLPGLVCPQSQCAQPHTNHRTSAQLSIMTQSNIWANHSNKPRTILVETTFRQWPRPACTGLDQWTTPDGCRCLLSIIISWHRLYLLYLVSSIYPVSRPTLYLYNQIVRHQHLQERYGRSTALAWLQGRKVCRKNLFKSTWFSLFSCQSFRIECSPEKSLKLTLLKCNISQLSPVVPNSWSGPGMQECVCQH